MKYAIIGAKGQVGAEFSKLLSGDECTLLTHEQVEVTDPGSLEQQLGDLDCSAIINLAAFHNVNECEKDPARSFLVNSTGAANVAAVARQKGCKVVYFSSDFIFGIDRFRREPYLESDLAGPVNVYGVSKLAGEQMTAFRHKDHLIIRTSSLFGACTSRKGWTFPEMILRRARANETISVVNDQFMAPTYTFDLVNTVIALIEADAKGVFHVTGTGSCSWYDFAKATLEMAGIDHPVHPKKTEILEGQPGRPMYSVLASGRDELRSFPERRDWKEALSAYLQEAGILSRSDLNSLPLK